jgi:hypothetical protein
MSFLRLWIILGGVVVGGLLLWSFAPILIPALLVAGGLWLVAAIVVAAARRIERLLGRGGAP